MGATEEALAEEGGTCRGWEWWEGSRPLATLILSGGPAKRRTSCPSQASFDIPPPPYHYHTTTTTTTTTLEIPHAALEQIRPRKGLIITDRSPEDEDSGPGSVFNSFGSAACPAPALLGECLGYESQTNVEVEVVVVVVVSIKNIRCQDIPDGPRDRTGTRETKPVLSHSSSSTEETRAGWEGQGGNDFVHAKFVPAGAQHVKVRQADRKTKAVKLRKKVGEKPRAARHQQHQQQHAGYSSGERARETQVTTGCRGEVAARSGRAKASPRLGEQRRHSGSDSSLCGPGFMHSHRVHPKPGVPSFPVVTKAGKGRRPQRPEAEQPPAEQNRRRRQGTGRWPPVDAEAFQVACAPRTREDRYAHLAAAAAVGRQMVPHAAVPIARPHSGQWGASHRSSVYRPSSAGFFSALDARYPPAPYPGGTATRYPARCESEYSAECASLFHSTIAASSVGDLSDDTTNRFGDSESSQSFSDSDSSLSLEEEEGEGEEEENYHRVEGGAGALVWAQSAQGPTAAAGVALRRPPQPEAPACRIKASRALKKKIRRFQPATLKVMTLV
ncbi:hypothetical protein CRUP_018549 [Coryphaenoides rupestris]|nr:hypothetical protein CRUP_018549 [Coryphaenoides rupestris]